MYSPFQAWFKVLNKTHKKLRFINNPLRKDNRADITDNMNNVAYEFIQNVDTENQKYTNLHEPAPIFFCFQNPNLFW